MLYKNTMWKLFRRLSPQEIYMKLHLYMMYMKIHKTILHHPLKMMNFRSVKNSILTKLKPPTDDLLDFISSQEHSDDQLDQVLQTYQAYRENQSENQTPTRQLNIHITYHVVQANQAKDGSLVDRGANGGLAGSDVRVLSTSPRTCTVTGIDNNEIPGLDLVQCAALVHTNHGMANLIMNEYAYYGRGHSTHSSGQIEWYTNTVDDTSVQVGGQQRIITFDGYSVPLVCKLD